MSREALTRLSARAAAIATGALLAGSVASAQGQVQAPPPPEVPSIVDQVADDVRAAQGRGAGNVAAQGNALVDVTPGGRLDLVLHSRAPIRAGQRAALEALGATVRTALRPSRVTPRTGLTEALVPAGRVDAVARLGWVRAITPAQEGRADMGSIMSEGVALHHADELQAAGIDGTGVTVGVVSDGVQNLASAVATNDLPDDVTVLDEGYNDEGTAMLEIVHDMAPNAGLLFDGARSFADYLSSLQNLAANGADVITDDIAWDAEPVFQRGLAATTIDDIAAAGVPVHHSAGNLARKHSARVVATGTGGGPDGKTFEATPPGCPYSPTNAVAIAPNDDTTFDLRLGSSAGIRGTSVNLQWSEPRAIYPTVGAGGFTNLDLFVMDAELTRCIAVANGVQANGVGDTLESAVTPAALAGTAAKLVVNVAGTSSAVAAPTLDLRWRTDGGAIDATTAAGSINPNVNFSGEAYAVGAVNANSGAIEPFSSGGPVQLQTTTQCPDGATGSCIGVAGPEPLLVGSPAFVAADGVSVTGAGTFPSTFLGTSAAAPHAAACDALLRDAIDSPNASVAATRALLVDGAADQLPTGLDDITGAGLLDCARSVPQRLSIDDATISEGDDGAVEATFNVSLVNPPPDAVAVDVAVLDGTATTAGDLAAQDTTLTFSGGQTTQAVTVTVNGDRVDELDETFTVRLSNPRNALLDDATGEGTITDDDEPQVEPDPIVSSD